MTKENEAKRPGSPAQKEQPEAEATARPARLQSFGHDFLRRNLLTLLLPTCKPVATPTN